MGRGTGHAGEVIRAERNGLVHARHAAIDLHPRAGAAAQVQVVPRVDVGLAPVVLRRELVGAREVNAPLGLAADVGAGLAAVLKLHVVEDLAVADERAEEPALVVAAVPLAVLDVIVPREEVIDRERGQEVSGVLDWWSFAGLALVMGLVGLYGVIAYSVSQRTREIGLRMAMGARPGSVYRMILKEAGWLTMVGITIGLVCAVGAANLMRGVLFGVSPWDVPTLVFIGVGLAVAAMLASFVPARRAARVNPVEALRAE